MSCIAFSSVPSNFHPWSGEAYVVGGLATLLALPAVVALRRLGERADVIEGKDCGCPAAPCAGQGLPEVNLIDAKPRR